MESKTKEASRYIDVVLRALEILDLFQDSIELTLKEIIDQTGLTRSRTMRLIGTLESRGYLVADYKSNNYYPGIKLAILGKSFEKVNQIEAITRPILKDLSNKTGESATFYVLDGTDRLALAREEGKHAIRYSVREGQRMPLHAGASGKVLLAYGPPELVASIKDSSKLNAITPTTITCPDALLKEMADVRKNGYAISKGENVADANAIAAPVMEFNQKLIGAIGIAAPINRLNDENMTTRVEIVKEVADKLSRKFGYSPKIK